MIRPLFLPSILVLLSACQSSVSQDQNDFGPRIKDTPSTSAVQHWGGMRDVLRNGNTQGRVALADVVGPNTIAVGALEGLGAEITILNGNVQLAEVTDSDAADGLHIRGPKADDKATLLVLANVPAWTEHRLLPVSDIVELEDAIREIALGQGFSIANPFPFRVEGKASRIKIHVLDHSCPIANPEGPKPWRVTGVNRDVNLVGFYAQDAAGVLTHHGQSSHIHAILKTQNISGHVDALRFTQPTSLFLPVR